MIHVDVPPADVWAVLADVDRWPEWTPTVRRIERDTSRPFGPGSEARLWLKGLIGSSLWRVTAYDPARRTFAWESTAPGVHTVAGHAVEPDGAGSQVTLTLSQLGIGSLLLRALIGRASRANVESGGGEPEAPLRSTNDPAIRANEGPDSAHFYSLHRRAS